MFYRDHSEQSRIRFKFCSKCVNGEQQEVVFQVRVTSSALLLQVKKPCPESDGSEPQNPRYGTGVRHRLTVAQWPGRGQAVRWIGSTTFCKEQVLGSAVMVFTLEKHIYLFPVEDAA